MLSEAETAVVEIDFGETAARIDVSAPFHDDPRPPGPPGPVDQLWNYEVVELFLVGARSYLEVELNPHGHYLVLELSAPRVVERRMIPIDFDVTRVGATAWAGTAVLPNALLPADLDRYNTYRVHGTGTGRRYLATFQVPGRAPDFHRLEAFGRLECE